LQGGPTNLFRVPARRSLRWQKRIDRRPTDPSNHPDGLTRSARYSTPREPTIPTTRSATPPTSRRISHSQTRNTAQPAAVTCAVFRRSRSLLDLLTPESSVRPAKVPRAVAGAAMPEASVNENCDVIAREHEVSRASRQQPPLCSRNLKPSRCTAFLGATPVWYPSPVDHEGAYLPWSRPIVDPVSPCLQS